MRFLSALPLLLLAAPAAPGYVEAPMPLSSVIHQSVVVCTMTVARVDRQKNLIVYRKTQDLKGKHPLDEIKHNIGFGGLRPGEWQEIMNWAEVGKTAVFFHNGGASETYTAGGWYQAYPQGDWWAMSHTEPFLLRTYAGKADKLGPAVADLLAGKEVLVPCLADGNRDAILKRTARVQRLRTTMKMLDYNPKRDFAGWGGEDIRRLAGLPGFDRIAAVGQLGPDALAASAIDFDRDGQPDVCLLGAARVLLLQNGGDAFSEVALPNVSGARAAVWADHDGDGSPDLLLATAAGPRLFTNDGKGRFRDDTRLLPREPCYNLTAAAWLDADGDGLPDILLANGFHGLRLYRNVRAQAGPKYTPPTLGDWYAVGPFRHRDGADKNAGFAFPPEKDAFDPTKTYRGKRDMECRWTKGDYPDGRVNTLAPFGANCSIYLHRELNSKAGGPVPVSFGNRDSVTVWLNGERLHEERANRPAAADQVALTLPLKPGKNRLLVKLTHGEGEGGFAFQVGAGSARPTFADVSAAWGFTGDEPKADALTTADFTGDGKPDVLHAGRLYVHTGDRFAVKPDAGVPPTHKVGPAAEDFDGDGHLDLFVPSPDGRCVLLRNDSTGRFAAVPAGDLSKPIPGAVGAAWEDIDTDGRPDLLVCCLRGPCRAFRNAGDGRFTETTAELGLTQKVFNTQAACWADLNGDGKPDLILANEGQESAVLFGGMKPNGQRTPVTLPGLSAGGRVVSADGKSIAVRVPGADGRGGQSGLLPRLALVPGAYRLERPNAPPTAFTVGATALTIR